MRDVAFSPARRPHYEQDDAVENPKTLMPRLPVGHTVVFARQQVAIKELFQVGKINPVLPQIETALRFVPNAHEPIVDAVVYTRKA